MILLGGRKSREGSVRDDIERQPTIPEQRRKEVSLVEPLVSDSLLDDEMRNETKRFMLLEASLGQCEKDFVERDGGLGQRREIAFFLDLVDLFVFEFVVVFVHAATLQQRREKIDEGRDPFGAFFR